MSLKTISAVGNQILNYIFSNIEAGISSSKSKMENSDLIWFLTLLVLLIIINTIHHLIDKSLSEKPLGSQSIYDTAIQDTFKGILPFQFFPCTLNVLISISIYSVPRIVALISVRIQAHITYTR